jgi:hypothetical protein
MGLGSTLLVPELPRPHQCLNRERRIPSHSMNRQLLLPLWKPTSAASAISLLI